MAQPTSRNGILTKTLAPTLVAQEKRPATKTKKEDGTKTTTRRARLVPFDPAVPYWLVVSVLYGSEGVDHFLFDPASVPDEKERDTLARRLNTVQDFPADYEAPSMVLEELTDDKAESKGLLQGDFARMPPVGTPVTITRVLVGEDIDY
jgi:hypothetical protein